MQAVVLITVLVLALLTTIASATGDAQISSQLAALAGRGSAAQRLALSGVQPVRNYIRLRLTPTRLQVQTASVSLALVDKERDNAPFELGLVSTVHLAEEPYYTALQREADGNAAGGSSADYVPYYDRVLFELLVDESSVETDDTGARRLREALEPAPALAALAAANRLTTQVGCLDCTRDDRWVLADVSRAELAAKEQDESFEETFADAPARASLIAPLRNLLGSGPSNFPAPFWRLLLCLLPAPEAALLLDDWVASRGAPFAPALQALVLALGRLDLGLASRLSFAQTLASGEATQAGSLAGALVRWRNARAVEEVERARDAGCARIALLYGALHMRDLRAKLQAKYKLVGVSPPTWQTAWEIKLPVTSSGGGGGSSSAEAASSGATAAADSGSSGAVAEQRQQQQQEDEDEEAEGAVALAPRDLLAPAAALLVLLAVDASDWVEVVGSLVAAAAPAIAAVVNDPSLTDPSVLGAVASGALDGSGGGGDGGVFVSMGEAALNASLYLARHALIYLALQRWAFQWDARWWAVESGRSD